MTLQALKPTTACALQDDPPMPLQRRLGWLVADRIAHLTAAAMGLVFSIDRHTLTEDQCEAQGRPEGSSDAMVISSPLGNASMWQVDVWVNEGDPGGRCLNLKLLGCWCEVFYRDRR